MSNVAAVEFIAEVPGISVDQFVKTLAADRFVQLQGGCSNVQVSFHGDLNAAVYQPSLDISLSEAAMPAHEVVERFRLGLFAEEFLRPFCSSLLLGADNATRDMLVEHFDTLEILAFSARGEFLELQESGHITGPRQDEFNLFAHDFVSLLSQLIAKRVCDPHNQESLRRLLTRLKLTSA
jgi:hypothetical protein